MLRSIQSHLSPEYPWADRIHWYETIGSTNDRAKELVRSGCPHGTAVLAGHQSGGRGRIGRTFHSPGGMGVYLSMVLRPKCQPQELMHLTCAVGTVMCDAVENSACIRPGIKWTNDLVYGKRKLGGILTELVFSPKGELEAVIVGIGVNCSQKAEDFPPEISDIAGSLAMVTGNEIQTSRVAAAMLEALHRMDSILLSAKAQILDRYRADCVTLGQDVVMVRGDERVDAHALDIDADGALLIRLSSGEIRAVNSGEVSIRGMYGYV